MILRFKIHCLIGAGCSIVSRERIAAELVIIGQVGTGRAHEFSRALPRWSRSGELQTHPFEFQLSPLENWWQNLVGVFLPTNGRVEQLQAVGVQRGERIVFQEEMDAPRGRVPVVIAALAS